MQDMYGAPQFYGHIGRVVCVGGFLRMTSDLFEDAGRCSGRLIFALQRALRRMRSGARTGLALQLAKSSTMVERCDGWLCVVGFFVSDMLIDAKPSEV